MDSTAAPTNVAPKRGVVRKGSKLSFMRKGSRDKEGEKDTSSAPNGTVNVADVSASGVQPHPALNANVDKDLPHRPGSIAGAGVSRSSSFLNVPSSIPEISAEQGQEADEEREIVTPTAGPSQLSGEGDPSTSTHTLTGTGAGAATINGHGEIGGRSPSDGVVPGDETVKPRNGADLISRDFATTPEPVVRASTPVPKGTVGATPTEYDLLANAPANDLCVRFDINVVKVCSS